MRRWTDRREKVCLEEQEWNECRGIVTLCFLHCQPKLLEKFLFTGQAIEYGAIITSVKVPNGSGELTDVVLGSDDLEWYRGVGRYVGATCGRVAGRIRGAKFNLEGKEYNLAKNSGENSLHGGPKVCISTPATKL